MKLQLLALIILISFSGFSQIGIGTTTPDVSAALDISATDKGLLLPRMTTVQKEAIVTPAEGLQVYDTITKSVWTFDGSAWKEGVGGAGKFIDGATSDIAYYEEKVGIGRNSFGNAHKLWVQGDKDTDAINTTAKIVANYNGTNNSTATYGLATEANNTSTGTIASSAGTLSATINNENGTISFGFGAWNYIVNNGTIDTGYGSYNVIYNQKGVITNGLGAVGSIENSAGAQVDNAYLVNLSVTNNGIMTNLYGAYFEYFGSSTVSNSYAIYVDPNFNKGTTSNYSIYSAPDIDSYIEGNVGFGIDKPLQKVHINGVIRLEPLDVAPSGDLGDLYVNKTDKKIYFHNGTSWVALN